MSVRDFLTQIIIALLGMVATFVSVLLPRNWLKIFFIVLSVILLVVAAGWAGIEYGLLTSDANTNRLDSHYNFETTDEGWSELTSNDPQADMKKDITRDHWLTGQGSLRVTVTHNITGTFKSYLRREMTITGHSVTIYVLAPELKGITINYIQVCATLGNWYCSNGTKIAPGEWTPITIDLSQTDNKEIALSRQQIPGLAIQWNYSIDRTAPYTLYFDAFEIKHSGS
jgi:hypothetical protein